MTCMYVMKHEGMLQYHICILSGFYVWAKIVEMMAVGLRRFAANLGSDALSAIPP